MKRFRQIKKVLFYFFAFPPAPLRSAAGRYVRPSLTLTVLALVVSTSSTTDAAVGCFAGAPIANP